MSDDDISVFLADKQVDEPTTVDVLQLVDNPSVTTVKTPDKDVATTPPPLIKLEIKLDSGFLTTGFGDQPISSDAPAATNNNVIISIVPPVPAALSDQWRPLAIEVSSVTEAQASLNLQAADAVATERAIQDLELTELSEKQTPSLQSISRSLQQLKQQIVNR